jgi:acyl-CoA thioester hydrolase
MPAVYLHPHRVHEDEIDILGHANNLAYLEWMQTAALAHSAAQGWPAQRYHTLGAGWVVRSHTIKYVRSALAGDELVVRTWVGDMKRFSSRREYRIERSNDGVLLAKAATQWAFIDFASGGLARIPQDVSSSFEVLGPSSDDD